MINYMSKKDTLLVGTSGSAGVDIACPVDFWVMPFSTKMVDLEFSIELPSNTFGYLAPRSSTKIKRGLDIVPGVIDNDYRGSIKAVVVNNTCLPKKVNKGERLVQLLVINLYKDASSIAFKKVDKLEDTKRGDGGFGSTGR